MQPVLHICRPPMVATISSLYNATLCSNNTRFRSATSPRSSGNTNRITKKTLHNSLRRVRATHRDRDTQGGVNITRNPHVTKNARCHGLEILKAIIQKM